MVLCSEASLKRLKSDVFQRRGGPGAPCVGRSALQGPRQLSSGAPGPPTSAGGLCRRATASQGPHQIHLRSSLLWRRVPKTSALHTLWSSHSDMTTCFHDAHDDANLLQLGRQASSEMSGYRHSGRQRGCSASWRIFRTNDGTNMSL